MRPIEVIIYAIATAVILFGTALGLAFRRKIYHGVWFACRKLNYYPNWRDFMHRRFGWEYIKYNDGTIRLLRLSVDVPPIPFIYTHFPLYRTASLLANKQLLNRRPNKPLTKYKSFEFRVGDVVALKQWWPNNIFNSRFTEFKLREIERADDEAYVWLVGHDMCRFHVSHIKLIKRETDLKFFQFRMANAIKI